MVFKQFEVWLADLNPQIGTETGKTRPVIIVQSNLLNKVQHPSTIICPITTNITLNASILRLNLEPELSGLKQTSDIMIDQLRAIDNIRLIKKIGDLTHEKILQLRNRLSIILDLEIN
ncbi:MAG: type II toxin-antitoxin system PemK/MazF family toxin [Saprospiraceae bacterium]|nr:type II toxin-antitoxin system PemK/MazF family toxin [Saprospiraceae bacterium]